MPRWGARQVVERDAAWYCAHGYHRMVESFGTKASMSCRGNCFDNAPMESFWGSIETELVHHRRFANRAEATAAFSE